MSHTLATPIIHRLVARPVAPPHLTLAAPSATTTGDPTKVPLSSLRPTVVHHEAPMLGESVQEMSKEGPV
jgi:hypothetical protein